MTVARRFWRWWSLGLIALTVGILGWPTDPAPEPEVDRASPSLPAMQPTPPRGDVQSDLDTLKASTLWGPVAAKPANAASAASPEPAWFVSGIYETPAGKRVLLHYENKAQPARQLAVGDKLPDGGVILAIDRDRLQIRPAPDASGAGSPRAGVEVRWVAINRGMPLPSDVATGTPSSRPGMTK